MGGGLLERWRVRLGFSGASLAECLLKSGLSLLHILQGSPYAFPLFTEHRGRLVTSAAHGSIALAGRWEA